MPAILGYTLMSLRYFKYGFVSFEIDAKNRKTLMKQKHFLKKSPVVMVLFSGYFVKYALVVKELPFKNIF